MFCYCIFLHFTALLQNFVNGCHPITVDGVDPPDPFAHAPGNVLPGIEVDVPVPEDQPLGFVLSAQTSARRYSGAPASYYGSTNTQLSLGAKAHLGAGERRTVSITVPRRQLQYWRDGWRDIETPRLFLGRSARDVAFDLAFPLSEPVA